VYSILKHQKLILTVSAIQELERRYRDDWFKNTKKGLFLITRTRNPEPNYLKYNDCWKSFFHIPLHANTIFY
jgi:hypothetical protein